MYTGYFTPAPTSATGTFLRIDGTNSPIANIDWGGFSIKDINSLKDASAITSINITNRRLVDSLGATSGNYDVRELTDSLAVTSIDWDRHQLLDATTGALSIDYDTRFLFGPNGTSSPVSWDNSFFYINTGATIKQADETTAPGKSIGAAIVNFYGTSATNFLGTPAAWMAITVNGSARKIPLY